MAWIDDNAELRRRHGILLELVLARSTRQNPAKTLQPDDGPVDDDGLLVVTGWPNHDTFDVWIDTWGSAR